MMRVLVFTLLVSDDDAVRNQWIVTAAHAIDSTCLRLPQ